MKREMSVSEFVDDLISRIDAAKTIDCCKEEIKRLAELAKRRIGDERIEVNWRD
jgi:hypothetical protein